MVDFRPVRHVNAAAEHERVEVRVGVVIIGPDHDAAHADHAPPVNGVVVEPVRHRDWHPCGCGRLAWTLNVLCLCSLALSVSMIAVSLAAISNENVAFVADFLNSNYTLTVAAGGFLLWTSLTGALARYVATRARNCVKGARLAVLCLLMFGSAGLSVGMLVVARGGSLYAGLQNVDGVPIDAFYRGQVNAAPHEVCAMFAAYNCSGYSHVCPNNGTKKSTPSKVLEVTWQPAPTDAECPDPVQSCSPVSATTTTCGALLERKVRSAALPLLVLCTLGLMVVLLEAALLWWNLGRLLKLHPMCIRRGTDQPLL